MFEGAFIHCCCCYCCCCCCVFWRISHLICFSLFFCRQRGQRFEKLADPLLSHSEAGSIFEFFFSFFFFFFFNFFLVLLVSITFCRLFLTLCLSLQHQTTWTHGIQVSTTNKKTHFFFFFFLFFFSFCGLVLFSGLNGSFDRVANESERASCGSAGPRSVQH